MTEAYDKLRERIARKRIEVTGKEEALKMQLYDIGNQLSPGKLITGAVKNVFSEVKASPGGMLKAGLGVGAGILADRLLFRKKGFLLRTAGMFVVRKLVNKFTSRNEDEGENEQRE